MKENHVFISYVRENLDKAERLKQDLENLGIKVWLDKYEIEPGQDWKDVIREAIMTGNYFIILFSNDYLDRDKSYVNEELNLAIEELRQRSSKTSWFIPAVLESGVKPPDLRIGGGRTLRDINWIDLSDNWEKNTLRIAKVIYPEVNVLPKMITVPPLEHNLNIAKRTEIKTFSIGKYPVTQSEWISVMDNNPSHFKGNLDLPVEHVSWDNVQEFIKKLNKKIGSVMYRLPTEKEWEFACLAGFNGEFGFQGGENVLSNYAWFYINSGGATKPVGSREANRWGIHDMHGNVCEWVSDTIKVSSNLNHTGVACKIKGGSFDGGPVHCYTSYSNSYPSNFRYNNIGFRLASDLALIK